MIVRVTRNHRFLGGMTVVHLFPQAALSSSIPSIRQLMSKIDVSKSLCQPVVMQGWIKTVRRHKDRVFMEVSDGSTLNGIQVVCEQPSGQDISKYVFTCLVFFLFGY